MVVDDRPENIMAIEAVLERPGLEIVKAGSGNEALRLLLKYDVALVLMDVQMPGMDGFEVAELMRRNRKTQSVPIIFITALSKDPSFAFKGYQSGAVDYLHKPFDPVVLESKVGVFLELARQRQELIKQLEEIRNLQSQNEGLLQALGEAIFAVDASGRITFANPAARELLMLRLEPIEGAQIMDILTTNLQGSKDVWITSEIFLGCRHGNSVSIREGVYARNGAQSVPIELSARPVNPPEDPFAGAVLVVRQRLAHGRDLKEDLAKQGRRMQRKPISAVLRVFDRTTGKNLGRMANLSREGFKLVTREKYQIEDDFMLSMVLPEMINGSNTLSFEAAVVWCQPSEFTNDYRCGFRLSSISDGDRKILDHLIENF